MDAGQTPTPLPDERGDEADSLEVAPAAPAVVGPPRNRLAVISFRFWLAAILVFVAAVVLALMATGAGQYMALLYYPVYSSVICVPLLLTGLVAGLSGLGRGKRLRGAIVAILLNLLTLPFAGFLLFVIAGSVSPG